MCAANGGHAKTVRLLLDRGAEINQKDTVSHCDTWMHVFCALVFSADTMYDRN